MSTSSKRKDHSELIRAATDTWAVIAHDAYQLCAEFGEKLTKEAAIEFILDADRIQRFGKYDPFENGYTYGQIERILKKRLSL